MTAQIIIQPFAAAGDLAVPPQTDPSGFVNWNQGYTNDYEIELASGNPQAKAVERPVQNALFNIITENVQMWQQLGFSQWYSSMAGGYGKNARVMRLNGADWIPYRSLVTANVTDPLVSPLSWEYEPLQAEVMASIPMPSGGPGGAATKLVTVATNFNTLIDGTWQIQSDAVAVGSANSPVLLGVGSTAQAGLLEATTWLDGATQRIAQRYLNRTGQSFFRGASAGVWTAWRQTAPVPVYTIDVGSVNLVEGTLPMATSVPSDNDQFWVKIAVTNTGATTFTPNWATSTPRAVAGQGGLALQGGELVAGGRALFVYKTDTTSYVLVYCSGGSPQVPTATKNNHAVPLVQAQAMVAGAATIQSVYFLGQI